MAGEPLSRGTETAGVAPAAPRLATWGMIGLLMLVAALCHFNRISITKAGNARIMPQYGIDPEWMGWIYSAYLITYTACMIPGGWAIDRFGAFAALAIMLAGSVPFVALTGVIGLMARDASVAFAALVIVRGLLGVFSAPLHPACARVVGNWTEPGSRVRANGLVTGSALVGIAATPPIFGFLIDRFDWPTAFLIASGITAAMALVWVLAATEAPGPVRSARDSSGVRRASAERTASLDEAGMPAPWISLLRDRSLIFLTLSFAAVGYFQYLFFYWIEYYFQRVLQLPESRSQFYVAIPTLAMGIGMVLGGWLSDHLERVQGVRWGRRIVPIAGMATGAVLLWMGGKMQAEIGIVMAFAMAMGGVGAAEGPHWATAIELGGRRGGSAAAILNTGGNAGGLLAPIITPWVGQRYGWGAAVTLGSLISLVGAAMWLGIDPGRKPPVPAPLVEDIDSGLGPGPL